MLLFFNIGGTEIIVIVLLALMLFGADKLPGIFKTFGKWYHSFKTAADDVKQEFEKHTEEVKEDIKKVQEHTEAEWERHTREAEKELDPYRDPFDVQEDGEATYSYDDEKNETPNKTDEEAESLKEKTTK